MNRLLRVLLMLKVLVMLTLGSSAVWAECENHDTQASSGQVGQGELMLAKSESEAGDQGQGGSADDDDSTTDEPDDEDEGA
ncbi:hypothetical protein DFS28_106246 [Pseudomonas sp. 478]|uniref:hypothetical protein n=1 Tax=unclassified Pseudomonas TaxID=196821 RepID=UPI000DAED460|nr:MULTISPECIES: hypothetical protein [unclassified Pseudomonas]PZW96349.1 hypothetical protein DFS28_106246 [Pseudomonas sp. 478]TCV40559.1 hypothetical protein EDB99_13030 [Pseudomonas sp. 460]